MGVLVLRPGMLLAQTTASDMAPIAQDTAAQSAAPTTHEARGVVTAVDPNASPQTVVVQTVVPTPTGTTDLTVGGDVVAQTTIRQGTTPKSLTDLQVGDRVWIRWTKTADTLVVDAIRILAQSPGTAG
jgi:hypothetical protein